MVMGTIIFIETPSPGDSQPRLKSNSIDHEVRTTLHQESNWYFNKSSRQPSIVMGTIIFIETPSLGD